MRTIRTEPLTPEGFAPYGIVVCGERGDVAGRSANQGTAKRYDWLGAVENLRPGARLNLCVFRVSPRKAWPLRVEIMEKHTMSTQVLAPMNADRYVVLVAGGNAAPAPDLSTLRAFVATGRQGIAYKPGTWHHPLIGLGHETDFACVVWEDESAADNTLVTLPEADCPLVELVEGL